MKRSIKTIIISFTITLLVIGGLTFVVLQFVLPRIRDITFLPNRNVVDFHAHFDLDPEIPQLIIDSRRLRDVPPPLVVENDGEYFVYLSAAFMRENFDPFLFWDRGAGVFFASTRYEMLEFTPGSTRYLVNGRPEQLTTPVRLVDDEIYMPADLLHGLYPLIIEFLPAYNMVVITDAALPQTTATAAETRRGVNVRYWGNSNAPITAVLEFGDRLTLFLEEGALSDDFVRVRTADGLLGYVLVSEIENIETGLPELDRRPILGEWLDNKVNHPPNWPEGKKINMVWELVYHPDANWHLTHTPLHDSLTVISPTWFRIDEAGTHLNSVASREYVDWAHSQGVYVWPLVFDVWYERSSAFLTNREARRHAINQLVQYVDLLNLDGINIDFEHLRAPDGPYKIQFLRELAIPMRERGVVLSAAVKAPIPATAFYRRDLIGLTVDFVMVMTYDEHWATSPVAGPNASLPWVQRAINNMLLEVPREKLIMGLPFYNRIWREPVLGEGLTQRARGMNYTRNFFEEHGVQWVWDSVIGSYFGEVAVSADGETVIYRVWLEDERSIRAKMQLFVAHDLAGVASWNREFANPGIWTVLEYYFR